MIDSILLLRVDVVRNAPSFDLLRALPDGRWSRLRLYRERAVEDLYHD